YALAMRLLWLASLIKRHQKVLISVQIVLGGAIRDEGIAVESDVRIPRSSGHPFHEHLTTDSTLIRPPIPRASGH
ncbi:hypothetical protein ACLPJF_27740, partial [Pseudomonas vlassakiae]|uniref:hypothetical protein n=1 Tax=Pseudomonas vlassakiae TaxID=485888 RepID=UPI003D29009F